MKTNYKSRARKNENRNGWARDIFNYLLFSVLVVSLVLLWAYQAHSAAAEYAPGQLIVRIKGALASGARAAGLNAAASPELAGIKIKTAELLYDPRTAASGSAALTVQAPEGVYKIILADGVDLAEAQKALAKSEGVVYAEPNWLVTLDAVPNDPGYSQQWHHDKIASPLAWNVSTGNGSVVVAIVDSGVDIAHEDLAANIWRNSREIPGNGKDDDGNGYIDDHSGYNFVNYPSSGGSDVSDGYGHGTHLAGIVAAVGNNGLGVCGVLWQAKIMPVKFVPSGGSGTVADAALAIRYAAGNGASVINLSFGTAGDSTTLRDAVNFAIGRGCLITASTGNENSNAPKYPAAYAGVLAVGATDQTDQRAAFSNYGSHLFLCAPGANIYSTAAGGGYRFGTGTSQAAPLVAGAAALLKSVRSDLNRDDLAAALKNGADDIGAAGRDDLTGWGRLNLNRSLAYLGYHPDYTAPTVEIITPTKADLSKMDFALVANVSSSAGLKTDSLKMTFDSRTYSLPAETYQADKKQLVIPVGGRNYGDPSQTSHQITLTVTDQNGRTGTASVTLTEAEPELALAAVTNCPNPLVGEGTYFCYNLTANADIDIAVFDLAGFQVKKIRLAAGSEGGRPGDNKVFWDGTSDFGSALARDVYFYLVTARSADGRTVTARGKLAVDR